MFPPYHPGGVLPPSNSNRWPDGKGCLLILGVIGLILLGLFFLLG